MQSSILKFASDAGLSEANGNELLRLISSILTMHEVSSELIPRDYRRMRQRVTKTSSYAMTSVDVNIDIASIHWSMKEINPIVVG